MKLTDYFIENIIKLNKYYFLTSNGVIMQLWDIRNMNQPIFNI